MPVGPRGHSRRGHLGSRLPFTLALLAALMVPSRGLSAEDRSGPGRERPEPQPAAARETHDVRVVPERPATAPSIVRFERVAVPPTAPGERPMVMIDAGVPGADPTEAERRKLEVARARVERARLAGTLYRTRWMGPEIEPLRADWESYKRALLRAQAPKPFADDPAAGVGTAPSVQKTGPAGLTAAEEAKRRAQASARESQPGAEGR